MEAAWVAYDWNLPDSARLQLRRGVSFQDETLRDGLQCPSVTDPPIEAKLEILHLMEALGIHGLDTGLPGAGPRAVADCTRLVREIVDQKLRIKPSCAGRTLKVDIDPIVQVAQATGKVMEADLFLGTSPVRQYAEGWTLERLLKTTEEAVEYAVSQGIEVMYVTEDTIRSHPETLRRLYTAAIERGCTRICLCDTVGHATPHGVQRLVEFMREVVRRSGRQVAIDWHGHRDRGLSVPNTLAALEAGVDRIHGTALGIGERVGNTPMEFLLLNLKLAGLIDNDLSRLGEYLEAVHTHCRVPFPSWWPSLGSDAFRITSERLAKAFLAERDNPEADPQAFSAIPPAWLGRDWQFAIGPAAGPSNLEGFLWQRPDSRLSAEQARQLFELVAQRGYTLREAEVEEVLR